MKLYRFGNLSYARLVVLVAVLVAACMPLCGQTLTAGYPGYQAIKTLYWPGGEVAAGTSEHSSQMERSLRWRYGKRTDSLFGEGLRSSSYTQTPGVGTNLRLTMSDNTQVSKGALRTHFYAQKINSDPRYKLLSINEAQKPVEHFGATDKDIRFRHQSSGIVTRMEVKEVKASTINANASKYKRQIDKMAAEARRTGERQMWVNRKETPAWFKDYARGQGIELHDNVVSGKGVGTKFALVQDMGDTRCKTIGRLRAAGGGASFAFGAMTAYASGRSLWRQAGQYADGERSTTLLRGMARDSGFMIGGIGIAVSGGMDVGRLMITSSRVMGQLTSISRYSGRLGWAGMAIGGGVIAYQWYEGDLSTADALHFAAVAGGGVAGAAGGAWAGALAGGAIGSFVPVIGTAAGALAGGIIGSFGGGAAGGATADATATMIRERASRQEAEVAAKEVQRKRQVRESSIRHSIFAMYDVNPS